MEDAKCIAGCQAFTGGEIYHHKHCPLYHGSLSQILDGLKPLADNCHLIEKEYHLNYSEIVSARGVKKGDIIFQFEWQKFKVIEERPKQKVFIQSYNEDGSVASGGVMPISAFTYIVDAKFRFDYR